ncbi:hypothetical protein ACWT_8082 [Actinoplanes sp. SE50]|uniref:DUF4097 family beta strand repeat-containing protein n=1 Tax=unclassified Actinoplanes TaxID=2626549 RepID=UPI00023EDCCD|nr:MULTISPECIES: DUF4097 family beta strand repeat-containing protein [unclassified Actinoplanes]AEV89091.1 hypothetical protein ACPL_8213 [Actinoplanes sp. SE50/110]ATO87497.1 hypothetical protein ACWT_8082 [Actinoplanes sp. SE50]SLM04915.1 uncharacterized protein ACSP50_8227 [Actinoplanes sp. SE50/110]
MKKYDTRTAIAAVIDIPAGRVQVIAADRTDTVVEVRPLDAAKSRDVKVAEQTAVDFTDGILRIVAEAKNQIFGASGSVEVTVQLPAGSRVEVRAASAEFRGAGRLGDVVHRGAHGAIKLDEAASADVSTDAGDVTIGRLTGAAEIRTQKGDIRIAETSGGDLTLSTQAGDITVDTAAGVSASLDAGTSYGRIVNSLRNAGGEVEVAIRATTSYGTITARSL